MSADNTFTDILTESREHILRIKINRIFLGLISLLIANSVHIMAKHFRHQDTKFSYNKHLLFVSWCLCGILIFLATGLRAK
jgi:hypothetical protein